MKSRVIFSTCFGIVALKSQVFIVSGDFSKTSLTSSRNPMLSISSASSRTKVFNESNFTSPLLARSISLPGVATKTSTPLRMVLCWSLTEEPPYTARSLKFLDFAPYFSISPVICIHNSLVGERIKAAGHLGSAAGRSLRICKSGSPNAAVFPVPVCANAIRSLSPFTSIN